MAQTRRNWFRLAVVSSVTMLVLAVPVLAEELMGVLSKVDVEGKKITITQKKSDTETVLTVTDETEFVTPTKTGKINLKQVSKTVAKAQEKGRPGIPVVVTHADGKASKVEVKAAKKKQNNKN